MRGDILSAFLLVTHGIQMDINITPGGPSPTWAPLGNGIENFAKALNEVVQDYQFFSDKGYARDFVTGMSISVELQGRRMIGDPVQDYICSPGVQYGLMAARQSQARLSRLNGDGTISQITSDVTFTAIVEGDGATTDGAAFNCTIHFDGEPQMQTITEGQTITVQSVAGAATGDTVLTTTPAAPIAGCKLVYAYGTDAPEATPGSVLVGWNVFTSGAQYTIASGQNVTVAMINTATNVVVASGNAVVVAKAAG